MNRRHFVAQLSFLFSLPLLAGATEGFTRIKDFFARKLTPVGRILEMEGWYVWCNSPIQAPDGKIHVFFSRWPSVKGMGGWINSSEIAHAVADSIGKPFVYKETVLAPRGPGHFDGTTCHNPHIKFVDGKYCLFYMGNSNGKTNTKRVGMATADTLDGPWVRPDQPLLEAGEPGAWDDHCTTNPAFLKHPNGQYWLYYKSWNSNDYYNSPDPLIRGNRKYGLAISDKLEGPYIRYSGNPVIDYSRKGNNKQFEDAFVWYQDKQFRMLARDMGVFNHDVGLYMTSRDGLSWNEPSIAYERLSAYINEPAAPKWLKRYGRLERPQLLFIKDKPAYLFGTAQGGKYMTASSFIFKID